MNITRKIKSETQDPRDFKEAKDAFSHTEGSWLLRNAVYMASKSLLITIIPLMAFLISLRVLFIVLRSLLNLTISCERQMANDVINPFG